MKKSVYICGDSFYSSDPESPIVPWHEQLPATNFSQVCASNFLINQQVKCAIESHADFIIVGFTSCTRGEILWNEKLTPFSWMSLDESTTFDSKTVSLLKSMRKLIDLDTEIKRNEIIIKYTLQKLVDSKIPFIFDQGGFEHKSYSNSIMQYFTEFDHWRSKICLWDYAPTRAHRPYFHITSQEIHNEVAEYYATKINEI